MRKKVFVITFALILLSCVLGFGYLHAKQGSDNGGGKGKKPPKIIMVKIAPNHRTMHVGQIKPFTANVIGKGKIDKSVTWSVEGGDVNGTITIKGSKKGIYEAPECVPEGLENGKVTITATSVSDTTKSGTAKIKLIGTECSSTSTTTTTTSTTTTESSTTTTETSTTTSSTSTTEEPTTTSSTTTTESSTSTTESSTTTSSTSSTTTTATSTTTTQTSTTTTTTEPSTTTSTTTTVAPTTTTTTSTTTTAAPTTTTTTTTTSTTTTTLATGWSTVQGIFSANCATCHTHQSGQSLDLTNCTNAHNLASSIKSDVDSGSMPMGGTLSPQQISTIDAWVNAGASCS